MRTFPAMKTAMVMRILRATCVLTAVLSLGSCGVLTYIFGSVFPATTMLAKAQANLSSMIPAGNGSSFNLRVVESGSYGFVVVTGSLASGETAFIYDLNLNLKATITGFTGNGVVMDPGGNIALGNYIVNPSTFAWNTNTDGSLYSPATGGVDGFLDLSASTITADMTFSNSMDTLGCSLYPYSSSLYPSNNGWGGFSSPSSQSLSNDIYGLQLSAVLDDGNDTTGNVIVVLGSNGGGNNNNGTSYFVTFTKQAFQATGFGGAGMLDSSPQRNNLEANSFGYAQGSIFAYDSNAASFVQINPTDGSLVKSFPSSTDPQNTRFAYRIGGGSFYGFDTQARVLTKYGAWW